MSTINTLRVQENYKGMSLYVDQFLRLYNMSYKQIKYKVVCPTCLNINKHTVWVGLNRQYRYDKCEFCTTNHGYYLMMFKTRPVIYNVSINIQAFSE